MSAFLGPIHFWLYNKIGNQELLTKEIADCATVNGWILEKKFSTSFEQEAVVAIGKPPKGHKFDLANGDRSIVAECKCYTWTDSGNVPSAKLMGLDEAVFYFGFLPAGTKKILCMKRATFQGKTETLAEYYVRVHGHLLGDVFVYEIADDGAMKEIRNGLTE